MRYNSGQVVNGIMRYADSETMPHLPVIGKWIAGTGIGVLSDKVGEIASEFEHNTIAIKLGMVDENGFWDVDDILGHMRQSADKYGKAYVEIPIIGKMSFTASDIDTLKMYIERG